MLLLYVPTAFLFSNIGTLLWWVLILILAGAPSNQSWSVYDIADFSVEALPNGGKGMSVEKKNALSEQEEEKLVKKAEEEARLRTRRDRKRL